MGTSSGLGSWNTLTLTLSLFFLYSLLLQFTLCAP
ncbi:hypothetical protein A1F99_122390 [Pyrenophora tritici-repentis]|nr:hypothetical protein A1F99_122390 [Pyrenophora tritici-repentis]